MNKYLKGYCTSTHTGLPCLIFKDTDIVPSTLLSEKTVAFFKLITLLTSELHLSSYQRSINAMENLRGMMHQLTNSIITATFTRVPSNIHVCTNNIYRHSTHSNNFKYAFNKASVLQRRQNHISNILFLNMTIEHKVHGWQI